MVKSATFANPDVVLRFNQGCMTSTTTVWYTNPIMSRTTTTGTETNLQKPMASELPHAFWLILSNSAFSCGVIFIECPQQIPYCSITKTCHQGVNPHPAYKKVLSFVYSMIMGRAHVGAPPNMKMRPIRAATMIWPHLWPYDDDLSNMFTSPTQTI
jgi:hypothetical protein